FTSSENPDGSVDLVFNIPKGGKDLLRLNEIHLNQSKANSNNQTTAANNSTQQVVLADEKNVIRSSYPLSLDSPYLINTLHICPVGKQVDYIIIVHSATPFFDRRRVIRETFGGKRLFSNLVYRIIFLLGRTLDPLTTKKIQEEAMYYKDIVQGPFRDSYHNLTHKGVLGFRWISEHCPQAKLILKIDDDVFINPFKMVREILPKFQNVSRHIACHLRRSGTSLIVRGKGKWKVHEDEFKGYKYYPFDHCQGYVVFITSDLIRPMLNAARLNPFFWIDDVYLFGILPATVGGATFTDLRPNLTLKFDTGKSCFEQQGVRCKYLAVSQWKSGESGKLWYSLLSNLTDTEKRELHMFGKS
uniref:Hexosyltransferase n=1 Tax=Biomphalaria glabrata TaxID=6526 RepID=A0A2C9K2R8_BIOGL